MMSDLTVILFTIGLTLLSVGSVMIWQERRYGGGDADRRMRTVDE